MQAIGPEGQFDDSHSDPKQGALFLASEFVFGEFDDNSIHVTYDMSPNILCALNIRLSHSP